MWQPISANSRFMEKHPYAMATTFEETKMEGTYEIQHSTFAQWKNGR